MNGEMEIGKYIKSFLIEFIMAFLFGIAGWFLMCVILIFIPYSWAYADDMYDVYFALFTGVPLGASLGILITKTFVLRTAKFSVFSVLCLLTSLLCGYLAGRYLWPALHIYIFNLICPGLSGPIFFPLVVLHALIGYDVMSVLWNSRKEKKRPTILA